MRMVLRWAPCLFSAVFLSAGLLSLLTGCGTMMISEPGALTGVALAGLPEPCGPEDRLVLLDSFDFNLFGWQIASGSLEWDNRSLAVDGSPDFGTDWTAPDRMADVLRRIAAYYGADLCRVEFNDSDVFRVSVPATYENFAYWIFPWHEVTVSAVLRKKR